MQYINMIVDHTRDTWLMLNSLREPKNQGCIYVFTVPFLEKLKQHSVITHNRFLFVFVFYEGRLLCLS